MLTRLRDIAGFLLRRATQPLFHPNFSGVHLGLDCRRCGSEERRPYIIIRVINCELLQPICSRYHVTDGRTDGRTTYGSNTALVLRTSCGSKYKRYYGPGRRPLAYLLYYMPTVSPACAQIFITTLHRPPCCSRRSAGPGREYAQQW